MKLISRSIMALALSLVASATFAAKDIGNFSVEDAMKSEKAYNMLGSNIKFYFGDQPHGAITKDFFEYTSYRKTNGSVKSDKAACEQAFLEVLKEFKSQAESAGGNAVVNIRSKYKNDITSSTETFKCVSGLVASDVTLVGEVVKIGE